MTPDIRQWAVFLVLWGLIAGSLAVWWRIVERIRANRPPLEYQARDTPPWNPLAVLTALGFVILIAASRLAATEPPSPSLQSVQESCVLNAIVLLILPTVLVSGNFERLPEFGLTLRSWREQMADGTLAFLASVVPVALALAAAHWFRGQETQHSFLKLLTTAPSVDVILWIALAVVILAPLTEELVFRVVLQGWLEQHTSPRAAVGGVAVLFSFVHGWRDGIPLLPLALILGYVFHRRQSYLAVVVMHALFNGTMLVLALLGAG